MDREQHRDAQARLESDYLAGAISADEYSQLRRKLHEGVSGRETVQEHGSPTEHAAGDPLTAVRLAGWGRRAAIGCF